MVLNISWLTRIFNKITSRSPEMSAVQKPNPYDNRQPTWYKMGGIWGDRIEWMHEMKDDGTGRIVGWKTPAPEPGDFIICPMRSGKTGQFRLMKIERCNDPRDMFFADVKWAGYFGNDNRMAEDKSGNPV